MALFSYNQVKKGLGEVQANHKWIIRIPTPAKVAGAFPEELQIRATSTSIPGRGSAEPIIVKLHNHTVKYNKGVDLSGTWTCTFTEGTDQKVQEYFNQWINARFETGAGDATGKSTDSVNLKAEIFIDLLAPDDSVTATYQMVGAMVQPLESSDLGQDGEAVAPSYTFDYDAIYQQTGGYNTLG